MTGVVVVGAGIVGASVGYHLARAGVPVTLLDRSLPATGVTGDSFGWIGGPAGGDVPDASTPLRRHALADWRRLEAEVPGVRVRWTGSLVWGDGLPVDERDLVPGERLADAAEVARLEPALRVPPRCAVHRTTDGAVDPVRVTEALVQAAREHGATVRLGVGVLALRVDGGRVTGVGTSTGAVPADAVVLAAGTEVPVLCAPLGVDVPVAPSPAVLIRAAAPRGLVRTLVSCPEVEVREAADGHLVLAGEYQGEGTQDGLRRSGEEMLRRLTATFAAEPDDVRLVGVRAGMRPMPAGGLPVVGPLPGVAGVHLTVMHPGVTLAPAVGRLVAGELVEGTDAEQLAGLRPVRRGPVADVTRTARAR